MTARLSEAEAQRLVVDTLSRAATGTDQAGAVARALVGAELVGQAGHGLRRLPAYAAQAASGKVDGRALPVISSPRPGLLAVDAAHGFAFPAIEAALAQLPDLAARHGIAAAGIWRSHHAGVTGLAVEALAEAGCVGLMFANAPAAIAPWGGRRALFGTNPIAMAAPVTGAPPVVIDLSVSEVARGKVMAAAQIGEPIPEGWALDRDGRPTTDPEAALAGSMVPMAGAKGAALALMVEVLAAALTGAHFGHESSSFFEAGGAPPGTGQLLIAIDATGFGAQTAERLADLAAVVTAEPGARLPGARRHDRRRRIREDGIAIDARLAKAIARAPERAP